MYDCEKCLHEEMCDQPSRHLWGTLNGEKECSDFKDRNNYVEVVRCKDCKKSGILEHNGKMFCKEPMGCLGCVPTKPDAFCSYGERKDNV